MKKLVLSFILTTQFLLINQAVFAQTSIQGEIANWSNGEVSLIFYDYISKEKYMMGTLSNTGKLDIPLPDNYISNMKEAAIKAKEKAPEGWEMRFNTVATSFGCSDEGFLYENDAAILVGLPDLEALNDDETTYGYLYCTNNPKLSSWLYNYGQGSIAKGYYLRWYYVENEASAKGVCNMPTYTGNDDENYNDTTVYDLKLHKGWNIIKYAITETFTSQNGKIKPSKTEITRIDELPADAQWLLISN